jgi:predicted KAP-like P-loop ATPase
VQNEALLPATIGVFGDWGSGKSSLLHMVRSELEKDDEVLCLSFNGWLFEGYDDAKAALMGTILDEIKEKRSLGEKAKEIIAKLLRRVDVFIAVFRSAYGHLGTASALPGPAWPSPRPLPEGKGE